MLTLQFGQCGNQLGRELFSKVSKDVESKNPGGSYRGNYEYVAASFERWFSDVTSQGSEENTGRLRIARAILIDTERKVLDEIRSRENSGWRYSRRNEIFESNGEGSGNNWSYGYFVKARELEDEAIEAVRRECERADRLDGFMGLLGTAGGTGSGVGSRIVEALRDEYSTKTILAIAILPFTSGEVGTQNYNGLLTLAKLTDLSDSLILFENDRLLRACAGLNDRRINIEETSLLDMNEVACEKILAAFQPIEGVRNEANFFANKMAAHPAYKITTIESTQPLRFDGKSAIVNNCQAGSLSWQIHVKQLRRALRLAAGASDDYSASVPPARTLTRAADPQSPRCRAQERSVANMLVTRGSSKGNATSEIRQNDDLTLSAEQFNSALYADWTPEDRRFAHFHENRRFLDRDKYVALVANNSRIRRPLDAIVDGAWKCYTHGAFLHRYEQFGLEDDDFLRAFAKIENVIKNYGDLDVP